MDRWWKEGNKKKKKKEMVKQPETNNCRKLLPPNAGRTEGRKGVAEPQGQGYLQKPEAPRSTMQSAYENWSQLLCSGPVPGVPGKGMRVCRESDRAELDDLTLQKIDIC